MNVPVRGAPIGTLRIMRTRFAFVHVPKSAGSSVKNAVAASCDPATVAASELDRVLFGGFDRFDEMPNRTRDTIAVGDAETLHGFDVVMGHFGVASLSQHFDAAEMMTVLREPRTRLLSLYTFWRGWAPERHADWDPYDASRRAVTASWGGFLADASIASQTDNVVARMLLSPHPSIPRDGFIEPADDDEIVDTASELLDRFGFADIVERGPALWSGLSSWLETPVEPERTLVTRIPADTDWPTSITPASAAALSRRTSIDARLWSRIASRHDDDAAALGEATFQRKLVGVGSAVPPSDHTEQPAPSVRQRLAGRLRR